MLTNSMFSITEISHQQDHQLNDHHKEQRDSPEQEVSSDAHWTLCVTFNLLELILCIYLIN